MSQYLADLPGAAVRAVENRGWKAVVFQGFCGDIDPVTNLNRWGDGTPDDLVLYGNLIAGRALKAEKSAISPADVRVSAAESRLELPLAVPSRDQLDRAAFADPGDYAAFCAPKFYSLFPFTADLEDIIVREGLALL